MRKRGKAAAMRILCPKLDLVSLLRGFGLAGGSWVQKGSFAAESADPGFSFIYTFLDLSR
jgi:hypothetical protein